MGKVSSHAGTGTIGFADGPGGSAEFAQPTGLAAGPGGVVIVVDNGSSRIRAIKPAVH